MQPSIDKTAIFAAFDRLLAAEPATDGRFTLTPEGDLTIASADGTPIAQLGADDTARLLVFLERPAARKLVSDIIGAYLWRIGGKTADLAARVYTLLAAGKGDALRAAVEQEAQRRGWEA